MRASAMKSFDRISHDPNVLGGKATIRGLRISVSQVVNMIANGMSQQDILRDFPFLEAEDIRQALGYVAALANEEVHELRVTG